MALRSRSFANILSKFSSNFQFYESSEPYRNGICSLWKFSNVRNLWNDASSYGAHQCQSVYPITTTRFFLKPQHSLMAIHNNANCKTRSYSTSVTVEKQSFLSRLKRELGITGKTKYKKWIMKRSGLRLYICSVELVNYDDFFKEFQLPDTFNSWFKITGLHVWMVIRRLGEEGKEGLFVRDLLVRSMWSDLEKRTRKLGEGAGMTQRKEGIQTLAEQFNGSIFDYEEAILSDNKVLEQALFRNFFDANCSDPKKLTTLATYIRKQIQHVDAQETLYVMQNGFVTFLPLHGYKEDAERNKQILREIVNRI